MHLHMLKLQQAQQSQGCLLLPLAMSGTQAHLLPFIGVKDTAENPKGAHRNFWELRKNKKGWLSEKAKLLENLPN